MFKQITTYFFLLLFFLTLTNELKAQVAINTDGSDPDSTAILDLKSTNAGILIPRMTLLQRDSINSPAKGLLVFVNTDSSFYYYNGSNWQKLGSSRSVFEYDAATNKVQVDTSVANNLATDDFIFGAFELGETGNSLYDNRMFFDKSKGAFRAGAATGDQWDNFKRGEQSFAAGYDVTASGDFSITLGEKSRATGLNAIALGRKTYAYGDRSFAWGNQARATAEGTVAMGQNARANAPFSYAVGAFVEANGPYSVAVGRQAIASDVASIALGDNVEASGQSAVVIGSNANASGYKSFSVGFQTNATGQQAMAIGHRNTSSARYSMAFGVDLISSGYSSVAIGQDVSALSSFEQVIGRYNTLYTPSNTAGGWVGTDRLFTVGNGTGSISRSDAFTILKNGFIGIGTSSPSTTLDIQGSLRLVDGNQDNGYVLTSDASGNATWQALNAGSDNQNLTGATLSGTTLEIDIENGSSASVNLSGLVDDADADPSNELQTISQSGNDIILSNGGGTISVADNDNDATNEFQDLSSTTSGTDRTINISDGIGTTISVADNDNDANNELQTISQSGNDITLSNGGGTISVADNDNDATNEFQDLSSTTSGTDRTINISDGIGTTISVADNDNDANNELQTISQSGNDITLSNGGGTISVADNDNDATNEFQDLSSTTSGTDRTINISDGTGTTISVADNDDDASNEIQALSISGNDISLSNGGGNVSIPVQTDLADDDNDTKIQVEESADEDIIRFDLAGGEAYRFERTATTNVPTIYHGDNSIYFGNAISASAPSGFNVVIGNNSGTAITSASGNVFLGSGAGKDQTTADNNTYIGLRAGLSGTTASGNVHVGAYAGEDIVDGDGNVILGSQAGYRKTTGSNNVLIGSLSGENSASGSGNVFIGYRSGRNETGSDKLYIENSNSASPLIYGEFGNDIVGINGSLGVGTQSPQDVLHVEGSIRMVDGNETAGYIPVSDANGTMVWTDPMTISDGDWTINGSDIHNSNAGNVGIGTPSPDTKFHLSSNTSGDSTGFKLTQDIYNSLIHHNNSGDLVIRKAINPDQLVLDEGGNVGIGTSDPTSKFHVEGSIRMVDGNQQSGYIPVSDANGAMTWTDPKRGVNFVKQTSLVGTSGTGFVDIAVDATKTIDVTTGDIISVWADANIRFTSGSGTDQFQYKVNYSGCATGSMEDKSFVFDEAGGHDNWTPLPYADAMISPCTGTLSFEYTVRRIVGDDPWEAINGIVIFRRN